MRDLAIALASNSLIAATLCAGAWLAWRVLRAPLAGHALAVLGLVKLLTPPLIGPAWGAAPLHRAVLAVGNDELSAAGVTASPTALAVDWPALAVGIWIAGSVAVLAVTATRHARLRRLLRRLDPAPLRVRTLAAGIAHDLGLRREPEFLVAAANVSPFVFAILCRPRLVLPVALVDRASDRQLRAVLAHELAHLRGGDHHVRWLELVVGVVFWWNPVAHALRAVLREVEEVRCDARAIAVLDGSAKRYGRAILATAEAIGDSAVPAGASGLDGGSSLHRRLRAIATGELSSRLGVAARVGLAAVTLTVLPFGPLCEEPPTSPPPTWWSPGAEQSTSPSAPDAAIAVLIEDAVHEALATVDDRLGEFAVDVAGEVDSGLDDARAVLARVEGIELDAMVTAIRDVSPDGIQVFRLIDGRPDSSANAARTGSRILLRSARDAAHSRREVRIRAREAGRAEIVRLRSVARR